jgi:4-hydroxybenzoate polyprenyltransferase
VSVPAEPSVARPAAFAARWWTYQRERFPLFANGALIAAFSFCAVSLSRLLRHEPGWPDWRAALVAFVSSLAFFLQLRIADEFKDYEEDARHRPYRPVQRGLVTLRELAWLFVLLVAVQLALALWLDPRLLALLVVTWAYLAAMSKEFFAADWLRRRPVLYMVSHMVIMPLVDLYATSCDWLAGGSSRPPPGLVWFLLASYFNGLVIEIGRKVRSPADEEAGVATYSALWGLPTAVASWWSVMAVTLGFAMLVAWRVGSATIVGSILASALAGAFATVVAFRRHPRPGRGKWVEVYSGVWTLAFYLGLGLVPHWARG